MERYDLVGRRVNGYAQATVEEHGRGAFVKYEDAVKRIAELEKECDELSQGQFVYAYYMQGNSNPIDFYNWLVKWNHLKASKIKEGE